MHGDDLLVGGARAAVLDESGDLADLLRCRLGIGQDAAEQLPAGLVAASPGQGKQHRALALAQVVAGRLAGGLRRAEDAQLVVAQLEGDADVLAEGGQVLGGGPARIQAGQEGADEQRVAHRVPGRLVTHDRQGVVVHASGRGTRLPAPGQGQVLAAHIEELAQGHLGGHGVEGAPGVPGRSAAGLAGGARLRQCAHLLAGQGQQEVTEKDGAIGSEGLWASPPAAGLVVPAEGAVRRGQAPSSVGAVHEIVMDQGAGLVELQRRTQVDGVGTGQALGSVLRRAQERAADGPQDGPHALTPAQDALGGLEQIRCGLPQVLPTPVAVLQDLRQTVLDGGTDTAQGRRQRAHSRQSRPRADVRRGGDAPGNGFAAAGRRLRTR